MGATTSATVTSSGWTELAIAGDQILVTPQNPGLSFWVRYSADDPGADEKSGHKYYEKDHIPNALLGGANTEKIWIRLVNGSDQTVYYTVI